MEKVKAFYETVKTNPNTKAKRKTVPVFLEGTWDGKEFISYDDSAGFTYTKVTKEEWITFPCDNCDGKGYV